MRYLLFIGLGMLTGCFSPGVSDPVVTWEIAGPTQVSSVHTKVFLPADLRRPTLVTHDQGQLTVHDFDRWGTPLAEALAANVAASVADLPIQNLVIQVQRLEVSKTGDVTLLFKAELTLNGGTLVIESGILQFSKRDLTHPSAQPLSAAFAAYSLVPTSMADCIRTHLIQEQGVIAKPAATVTVPSK